MNHELITCDHCQQQIATVGSDRRPLAATGHAADVQLTGGDCACIWCSPCERWREWAHVTALEADQRAACCTTDRLTFPCKGEGVHVLVAVADRQASNPYGWHDCADRRQASGHGRAGRVIATAPRF